MVTNKLMDEVKCVYHRMIKDCVTTGITVDEA